MRNHLAAATRAIIDPRGDTNGPISDALLNNMLFECIGFSWIRAVTHCTSGCAVDGGTDGSGADSCRSGLDTVPWAEEIHEAELEL